MSRSSESIAPAAVTPGGFARRGGVARRDGFARRGGAARRGGVARRVGFARRGGFLLGYLVAVFPLLIVGSAMVVYLLVQILAGLRVTSTVTSDYATLSDLLRTLRVDTRSASDAEVGPAPEGGQAYDQDQTDLVLRGGDGTVAYRFSGPRVVRRQHPAGGRAVERVWALDRIAVTVWSANASAGGASLVHLTARWPGDDRHALRRSRRFDTSFFVGRSLQ